MRFRFVLIYLKLALAFAVADVATNSAAPSLDPTEKNITRMTAELLQRVHFTHHPLDKEMAAKFFDRYIESIDPFHLYLLQTDLDEFETYRTNLHQLTAKGDVTPCRAIYARYLERLQQRFDYVTNLVQTEKFEFTGHDRYIYDRHKMPAPKDLDDAKNLWHQHLRYEYLEEKLSAPDIKFTGTVEFDKKGNPEIHLQKTKSQPLTFEFLPKEFFGPDKKSLGSVRVEKNESNAVVRLEKHHGDDFKSFKKKIFSAEGEDLGTISLRWKTNDLSSNSGTNATFVFQKKPALTNAVTAFLEDKAKPATTNHVAEPAPEKTAFYAATIQLNQKNLSEIPKTLIERYTQIAKIFKDLSRDEVFEIYINSLAHSYDWHTDYMGKATFDNFKIQMSLHLFGIGAQLTSKDGYCTIKELLPGPAMNSKKVRAGDRIVAVAQGEDKPVDVKGMPLNKVVEKIRGPKGTEVRITVIPADSADSSARETIALIRAEIHLEEQETKAKIFETPAEKGPPLRLGYIDLPAFYADMDRSNGKKLKSATDDVVQFLKRFKKENVSGVILDLRANGGGYLDEAITLTGQFITKGPVVQTKESTGEIITESDPDPSLLYDGPLIVLTSRGSASASEILAGALQDYDRALIVGDRSTFGKGTVQTTQDLGPLMDQRKMFHEGDPGTIKPTIRKFYRAAGSSTQNKGVVPDIELPSVNNFAEFGEAYLPNTLEWDTVPSADPENLDRVKPYLDELKKRSAKRIEKEKDWSYVREDIEQYKKTLADKSGSLNEAERLAEKKELEAKIEARKKDRQSRKKSTEKVFELTLKNIGDAELHPPVPKTNTVAKASVDLDDDVDSAPDGKTPDADVRLEETKRILADYVSLLGKAEGISKAH